MKVLRGTLTFVLGMIVGIILFVLAIGGTVVALATAITVGDLQSKFTDEEIVSSDSNLYNQTLFDAAQSAIGDFQNFDQLSLKTLYDHYGISLLNGIGGIDFTNKEFYTTPLTTIMGDFSVLSKSFTLRDVGSITGTDFDSYNLPILKDNLDKSITDAIDNILGSVKGDLTVRSIKTNLIPDFDTDGNELIKNMQDIPFNRFASAINAFRLCSFLSADTDTFVPSGAVQVYIKVDRYEKVSTADLKNASYVAPDGVELYYYDAKDTNDDGTEDIMLERELRFVNRGTDSEPSWAVDNTCYNADFNADETNKTFYRHYIYEAYSISKSPYPAGTEFFVKCYGNRVTTFDVNDYALYQKGYLSLKDVYVKKTGDYVELNGEVNAPTVNFASTYFKDKDDNYIASEDYYVKDAEIKKSSKLVKRGEDVTTRDVYIRVHEGTSAPLLQSVAFLTIAELQDMDDFVDDIRIGDVITVKESDSAILKSLKDKKLSELGTATKELKLGEIIDINYSKYTVDTDGDYTGDYVFVASPDSYIKYNANVHPGMQRYARSGEAPSYTYTPSAEGEYVKNGYFVKYDDTNPVHTDAATPKYVKEAVTDESSLIMQALALRDCTMDDLSTITDKLFIYEVIDVSADDASLVMKSLAARHKTIETMGAAVDELTIDEVIEINDGSSLIMRSLKAQGRPISELGSAVDDLTIDQVIEINDGSSRLLKSLKKQGTTIGNLGDAISNLKVCDVIDIYEYNQVEISTAAEDASSKYLIGQFDSETENAYVKYNENNPEHALLTRYNFVAGEYVVAADGQYVLEERAITYVKDSDGKYIKSPIKFEVATDAERGNATLAYYEYVSVSAYTPSQFDTLKGNVYYYYHDLDLDTYTYINNVSLGNYIYHSNHTEKTNLYKRAETATEDPNRAYYKYDGTDLYVNLLGRYIAYDPANPAHADMTIYKLHTSTDYDFFVRLDEYKNIKVDRADPSDPYEYVLVGGAVLENQNVRYSKQFCEKVYVKDANGTYVYIDDQYVEYDAGNEAHAGKDRFNVTTAFLANATQADGNASRIHVNVLHEKSAAVVRMMRDDKVDDMGIAIADATIEDLMDISPDNMFDEPLIRTSKINDLGNAMSKLMNEMTIGRLLDWANITSIDSSVKAAIENATIQDFFQSLAIDEDSKYIYIDMFKLNGLKVETWVLP
ncbi:MAG: hypothetical protein J5815_00975 [Clostridia bacterium]|nr:hypothetical protein [Clostridia bacterium]